MEDLRLAVTEAEVVMAHKVVVLLLSKQQEEVTEGMVHPLTVEDNQHPVVLPDMAEQAVMVQEVQQVMADRRVLVVMVVMVEEVQQVMVDRPVLEAVMVHQQVLVEDLVEEEEQVMADRPVLEGDMVDQQVQVDMARPPVPDMVVDKLVLEGEEHLPEQPVVTLLVEGMVLVVREVTRVVVLAVMEEEVKLGMVVVARKIRRCSNSGQHFGHSLRTNNNRCRH